MGRSTTFDGTLDLLENCLVDAEEALQSESPASAQRAIVEAHALLAALRALNAARRSG